MSYKETSKDVKQPAALQQKELLEGYESAKILFIVVASGIAMSGAIYFSYTNWNNSLIATFMALSYLCGISISDRTLYKLGKATSKGEVHKRDKLWVYALKMTCYADIFLGMIAKGLPEAGMEMYFFYGIPLFTVLIFIQWENIQHNGERAQMLERKAAIEMDEYISQREISYEEARNKIAKRMEQIIVDDGRREMRLALSRLFTEKMKKNIVGFRGRQKVNAIARQKVASMLDPATAGEAQELKEYSGDGQSARIGSGLDFSDNPIHTFSLNMPSLEAKTRRKTKKRRKKNCGGCGDPLPVEFNDQPWNSIYCPEDRVEMKSYGQPRSSCKTAASRKA